MKSREIERREEWLADSLRRAQRRLGIRTQDEFAEQIGMTRSTYQNRLREPGTTTLNELWRIEAAFRHAGMTDEADTIRFAFASGSRKAGAA